MKKIILLSVAYTLATLVCTTINAQQFEWVKGFSGSEYDATYRTSNKVNACELDSKGNLYVLGTFGRGAELDGQLLFDEDAIGIEYCSGDPALFVAKLSNDGRLLWKKVIHRSQYVGPVPEDLHIIGDSVVMFNFSLFLDQKKCSNNGTAFLYFLDTLLYLTDSFSYSNIPSVSTQKAIKQFYSGFVTLDLDGNLKEDHFLHCGYIDTTDNVIREPKRQKVSGESLGITRFTVDGQGNLYLYKVENPRYFRCGEDDTIHNNIGMTFYKDGDFDNELGRFYPVGCPANNNPMILKFTPHFEKFDTLRFLYPSDDTLANAKLKGYAANGRHFITDKDNYLYLSGAFAGGSDGNYAILDIGNNYKISVLGCDDFLIKFDSNLNVIYAKQLTTEQVDSSYQYSRGPKGFFGITLREETNSLFLLGGMGLDIAPDTVPAPFIVKYNDSVLNLRRNSFFLQLNKDNGDLISYGDAHSKYNSSSNFSTNTQGPKLAVKNNRVFAQIEYMLELRLDINDTVPKVEQNNINNDNCGIIVWDEDGHSIGFIDYNMHPGYKLNNIVVDDNCNIFAVGNVSYHYPIFFELFPFAYGGSAGYIFKYSHPEFKTPFVWQSDVDVADIFKDNNISIYPNPAKDIITINTEKTIDNCFITDIVGNQHHIDLLQINNGKYTCNLAGYKSGVYILSLLTTDSKYNVKLIKK
ncbi:MAG: T9SS type A sorting domain-containing protein [Clostridia bacterium]|nr:T9SS type A sorting domain-containing protein [Clostridia bacterium]